MKSFFVVRYFTTVTLILFLSSFQNVTSTDATGTQTNYNYRARARVETGSFKQYYSASDSENDQQNKRTKMNPKNDDPPYGQKAPPLNAYAAENVERTFDENGRKESITTNVQRVGKGEGTGTGTRDRGEEFERSIGMRQGRDDRGRKLDVYGHIVPRQLGGSGLDRNNLIGQDNVENNNMHIGTVNEANGRLTYDGHRRGEDNVYRLIDKNGGSGTLRHTLIYPNQQTLRTYSMGTLAYTKDHKFADPNVPYRKPDSTAPLRDPRIIFQYTTNPGGDPLPRSHRVTDKLSGLSLSDFPSHASTPVFSPRRDTSHSEVGLLPSDFPRSATNPGSSHSLIQGMSKLSVNHNSGTTSTNGASSSRRTYSGSTSNRRTSGR